MTVPVATLVRDLAPRLLEGLEPGDIETILAAASHRRVLANSVIANEGSPAEQMFLLLTGRARRFLLTPDGQKVSLLRVPPGEILGEATLLVRPSHYIVSSEVTTNSSVLAWDRRTIRGLCTKFPRLVENALLTTFDYLVVYRTTHISLLYDSAEQRLAQVLANLAAGIGQNVPRGVELDVRNLAEEALQLLTPQARRKGIGSW